jgi:hypothetical protein
MKRLYRVIRYLDNTINLGLTCHVTVLSLHAYMDESWACHAELFFWQPDTLSIGLLKHISFINTDRYDDCFSLIQVDQIVCHRVVSYTVCLVCTFR